MIKATLKSPLYGRRKRKSGDTASEIKAADWLKPRDTLSTAPSISETAAKVKEVRSRSSAGNDHYTRRTHRVSGVYGVLLSAVQTAQNSISKYYFSIQ